MRTEQAKNFAVRICRAATYVAALLALGAQDAHPTCGMGTFRQPALERAPLAEHQPDILLAPPSQASPMGSPPRSARAPRHTTAICAGADMVVGSHPHWAQSIESYNGRLIVYSLANFIFDQDWSRETLEGFMLHLYWRGKTLAGIRFVPTLIEDRCQPRIMSPAEAVGVFERMWSGSDLLSSGQYTPGQH